MLYKVIARGFYGGKLYDPDGKRPVLDVPKSFKKGELPSWLAEMPKVASRKAEAKKIDSPPSFIDPVEDDESGLEVL